MKIKTNYAIVLLLFSFGLANCGSSRPDKTPSTVAEAEKLMAQKQKKQARAAKKAKKQAYKIYWKAQTKEAKKSIKLNNRRQKRIARHNKKR
jgi:hypothetical protein